MTNIFNVDEVVTPAAESMAKGFKAEANQEMERIVNSIYDAVQRFWFRNVDSEGNPSPVQSEDSQEPTGPEILEALGFEAQPLLAVAFARVQMVLSIAQQLQIPNAIDFSKLDAPYKLTWLENGLLEKAELKEAY